MTYASAVVYSPAMDMMQRFAQMVEVLKDMFRFQDQGATDEDDSEKKGFDKTAAKFKEDQDKHAQALKESEDKAAHALGGEKEKDDSDKDKQETK